MYCVNTITLAKIIKFKIRERVKLAIIIFFFDFLFFRYFLIDFISEIKFDRLGVFSYSQEEGTPAAKMEGQIDDDVKEERRNRILECQKFISAQKCESMVGKVIKVIIDGKIPEENIYCGRCYKDAPDIDGMVFIKSDYELLSGDFADVLITEASDYDLIGETYYGDEFAE